jgi:hypothetical protein
MSVADYDQLSNAPGVEPVGHCFPVSHDGKLEHYPIGRCRNTSDSRAALSLRLTNPREVDH